MSDSPKPTILYVEDDQQNFDVAELRLGKRFTLLHAPDDQTACRLLETHAGKLAAVLMDVELKGSALDGIALTRLLRGKLDRAGLPAYAGRVAPATTPIIIVTAYAGQYSPMAVKEVGADNFFTKPVDFVKLTLALAAISAKAAITTLTQG